MSVSVNVNEGKTVRLKCVLDTAYDIDFSEFTNTYTIALGTGTSHSDINNFALTGNLSHSGNTVFVDIPTNAGAATEGNEAFSCTFSYFNGLKTETFNVTIIDAVTPTDYMELTSTAASYVEGSTVTFNFSGPGIVDGTSIGYTLSGSAITDGRTTDSTTGTFTVNSETGSFNVSTVQNTTHEGTDTLTCTLDAIDGVQLQHSVNITDDESATFNNFVNVPLSWSPGYDTNDSQLTSCTAEAFIKVVQGETGGTVVEVPTAVSVTKGNPSTLTVTATALVDTTANQGGYKAQLITAFNTVGVGGVITGSSTADVIGYNIS